jgi:hypothetical protein
MEDRNAYMVPYSSGMDSAPVYTYLIIIRFSKESMSMEQLPPLRIVKTEATPASQQDASSTEREPESGKGIFERLAEIREKYRTFVRGYLDRVIPGLFDGMDKAGAELFKGAIACLVLSGVGLPEVGLLVGGGAVVKAEETVRNSLKEATANDNDATESGDRPYAQAA